MSAASVTWKVGMPVIGMPDFASCAGRGSDKVGFGRRGNLSTLY